MVSINYDRDSYNRCNCGGCPAQLESKCVQDLESRLALKKEQIQREGEMPDPDEMPGVYCADPVGKSSCVDIQASKSCLCPACTLAIMEGLENSYYCLKGSAGEVG